MINEMINGLIMAKKNSQPSRVFTTRLIFLGQMAH